MSLVNRVQLAFFVYCKSSSVLLSQVVCGWVSGLMIVHVELSTMSDCIVC